MADDAHARRLVSFTTLAAVNPPLTVCDGLSPPLHKGGCGELPRTYSPRLYGPGASMLRLRRQRDAAPVPVFAFAGCVHLSKERNDCPGTGPLPRWAIEPSEKQKNSPIGGVFCYPLGMAGCMSSSKDGSLVQRELSANAD